MIVSSSALSAILRWSSANRYERGGVRPKFWSTARATGPTMSLERSLLTGGELTHRVLVSKSGTTLRIVVVGKRRRPTMLIPCGVVGLARSSLENELAR